MNLPWWWKVHAQINKAAYRARGHQPSHTFVWCINDSRLRVCTADRYRICMSNEAAMPFSARAAHAAKSKSAGWFMSERTTAWSVLEREHWGIFAIYNVPLGTPRERELLCDAGLHWIITGRTGRQSPSYCGQRAARERRWTERWIARLHCDQISELKTIPEYFIPLPLAHILHLY